MEQRHRLDDINLHELYESERARWIRSERPRRSPRDLIAASVPYWIIIVGLSLFLLSAPHTAGVFEQLTPGFGFIAPLGVEFGLLYSAFRRRLDTKLPPMLHALQILFFVTGVLVNSIGSFTSVMQSIGLSGMSFTDLGARFGTLPAISQVALIMSVLAGFIVPIGALAAGEGIAFLVLRKDEQDYVERRWKAVAQERLYRILFVKLNGSGLPAQDAARLARNEVRGLLESGSRTKKTTEPGIPEKAGNTGRAPDAPKRTRGDAVAVLDEMFAGHSGKLPAASEIIRQSGLPKSTVYDWLKKRSKE